MTKCKMNNVNVNLYIYCSKHVNLHNYIRIYMGHFQAKLYKFYTFFYYTLTDVNALTHKIILQLSLFNFYLFTFFQFIYLMVEIEIEFFFFLFFFFLTLNVKLSTECYWRYCTQPQCLNYNYHITHVMHKYSSLLFIFEYISC